MGLKNIVGVKVGARCGGMLLLVVPQTELLVVIRCDGRRPCLLLWIITVGRVAVLARKLAPLQRLLLVAAARIVRVQI